MMGQVLDCDEWRRNYENWTVADHKRFYAEVWAQHPSQSHAAHELMGMVLATHRPRTVIEVGGWDGELAIRMLEMHDFIERWTNVEICEQAVHLGHYHPRYFPTSPDTWFWDNAWNADMLVASHCIEHMTAKHLEAMIRSSNVDVMVFDAPLQNEPTSWWGSWIM
jgi:hypothetical protein